MKSSISSLIALLAVSSTASAHLTVTGDKTLNSGLPIDGQTATNILRTVSSSFGWADATDANFGDSHRLTPFKFTLASVQTVSITVARRDDPGQGGAFGLLLPAFSLFTTPFYVGNSPVAPTHDSSAPTTSYLTGLFGSGATGEAFTDTGSYVNDGVSPARVWQAGTLNAAWDVGEAFVDGNGNGVYDGPGIGGSGKEGAVLALQPWKIHNDAGNEMFFNGVVGHAADGTAANYGTAPGINGDGTADGTVSATFNDLPAGDYYLLVGGGNYAAQNAEAPIYGTVKTSFPTYGIAVSVSAIPEPASASLLALGALGLGWMRRRHF